MEKITKATADEGFEKRIEQFAQYLLALRKMQDKNGADFIASLGNLSLPELNVLNIIGDNQPCIMSDIAKHASLSLSSVTVNVEKLVKAKLVKRLRNDEDRRIVHGSLTPEGQKIYQIQIERMHEIIRHMLSGLTQDEQETLINLFQKITQARNI